MKLILTAVAALAFSPLAFAADQKVEGKAVCAKCELHEADKCRAAVQVTSADGKKETILSEPNDKAKDLHSEICKGGKDATVEGTVTEKDGKKTILISKFELK